MISIKKLQRVNTPIIHTSPESPATSLPHAKTEIRSIPNSANPNPSKPINPISPPESEIRSPTSVDSVFRSDPAMYSDDESEEYLFKIVVIGDSAVGKSNLLSRYARNEFDMHSKATIGVEFQTQCLEIDGREVKAQIWDTAGQERFRAVTSAYYRGAVGALVVYDISRSSTFESVSRWLDELNKHCDTTMPRMLVGNKSDLDNIRAISVEEGKSLAEEHGMFFMETSAKNSTNVDKAFEMVIKDIFNSVSRKALNSEPYKAQLSFKRVSLFNNADKSKTDQTTYSCCSY